MTEPIIKRSELLVISGGQTGVDQAALAAARAAGIRTGGTIPFGCMTLEGCRYDLRDEYGLVECDKPGYSVRTDLNAANSDATIRIAKSFSSPGERCTLMAIKRHAKLYLDVRVTPSGFDTSIDHVVAWLIRCRIKVLNVAGNSEATAPGIYELAYSFLFGVFMAWPNALPSLN